MSILTNLKKVNAAIVVDKAKKAIEPNNNAVGGLSARVNSHAVDALINGIKSKEWAAYMSLFANNAAELAQLADPGKTEGGQNPWLKQMRAYIVSNAICDIGTNGNTAANVDAQINIAEDQEDAAFIATRPFEIPNVV